LFGRCGSINAIAASGQRLCRAIAALLATCDDSTAAGAGGCIHHAQCRGAIHFLLIGAFTDRVDYAGSPSRMQRGLACLPEASPC
jgi:hypothetical protein